jgi:hypothetical protein
VRVQARTLCSPSARLLGAGGFQRHRDGASYGRCKRGMGGTTGGAGGRTVHPLGPLAAVPSATGGPDRFGKIAAGLGGFLARA